MKIANNNKGLRMEMRMRLGIGLQIGLWMGLQMWSGIWLGLGQKLDMGIYSNYDWKKNTCMPISNPNVQP